MSRTRRLALVCALALAFALAAVPPAFAKSYHVASIDMVAQVGADGSMAVTEQRAVTFSGNFHWAQWALDTAGSEGIKLSGIDMDGKPMTEAPDVSDAAAAPSPGTYMVSSETDRLVLKVGFDVTDATPVFTLRYTVAGAAKRWKDTSELYWKFVGGETDVPTDRVHVTVELPAGVARADVKAWAHGPLNGVVAIGPDAHVTLDVTALPANTFVEGRILFPSSALGKAPLIDQPRAAAVMQEEAGLAEQANQERRAAKAQVALAFAGGFGVPLLGFAVVLAIWFAFGREYKPTQFPGGYFRDIPADIAPPLVAALWRMGQPADTDVGATLMDLSLKGAVYMQPITEQEPGFLGIGAHDEPTYELKLDRTKLAQVKDPLEHDLVKFLFDDTMGADSFTMHDLRDTAKSKPQAFTRGLSAWKAQVARTAEDQFGWVEKRSRNMTAVAFVIAFLSAIPALLAMAATQMAVFFLAFIPPIAAFVIAFQVRRRSREAVELFAKYRGLRDYLRDFSRLDEKPPDAIVLWEGYLVLAVVFGIAEQVIQQLRVAVPQVVNDPAFATAYWWTYPSSAGGMSPVGTLSSGFVSAVSAANSAMSSASGGGGGFSGGGGGGGGGGGFSAG